MVEKVEIPFPQNSVEVGDVEFNFFLANNQEYAEGQQNLECHGVILYFLHYMSNKAAFNEWFLLNWEAKGVS